MLTAILEPPAAPELRTYSLDDLGSSSAIEAAIDDEAAWSVEKYRLRGELELTFTSISPLHGRLEATLPPSEDELAAEGLVNLSATF